MAWVRGSDIQTEPVKYKVGDVEITYYMHWYKHQIALKKGLYEYWWESDPGLARVALDIRADGTWPVDDILWSKDEVIKNVEPIIAEFEKQILKVPILENGEINFARDHKLSRPLSNFIFYWKFDKARVSGTYKLIKGKKRIKVVPVSEDLPKNRLYIDEHGEEQHDDGGPGSLVLSAYQFE